MSSKSLTWAWNVLTGIEQKPSLNPNYNGTKKKLLNATGYGTESRQGAYNNSTIYKKKSTLTFIKIK